MRVRSMNINRIRYGTDEGKLSGEVEFENPSSKISIRLSDRECQQMLELVAASLISSAKETAALVIEDIQRPQAQIEGTLDA